MIKYSIRYYVGNPALEYADEIIIKFHNDDTGTGLLNFIEEKVKSKQRLIVDLSETDTDVIRDRISAFKAAANVKENFALKLNYEDADIAIDIYSEGIKFFFNNHINTWEKLNEAIKNRVSDVYITDDLGFDLVNVSKVCRENNIKVRVYPNVAQTLNGTDQNITSFYIRPEDEFIYRKYIDVYEFWGPLDRQKVLLDIYKDYRWDGDLGTLILNLPVHVNSSAIVPCFGEARSGCKHRCTNSDVCEVCGTSYSFGRLLMDAGKHFIYEYDKDTKIDDNI